MKNLTDWLRQLITIIIVAGFIEMMAPENSLKKTVKLVIGLMVMVVLLQPLTRFYKIPLNPDEIIHLGQIADESASQKVLERGQQIRDRWQKGFNSQQQALAKEKIASVIGLIDDIELREVRFSDSRPLGVIIRVSPAGERGFSKSIKDKLTTKIQRTVRLVDNFPKEQVEVIWDENSK
ncbi:MAG: stage III sporulation protein AF [Bacteroidota bacterium]